MRVKFSMTFEHLSEIVESTPSRIVLLVMDGLGGLRDPATGKSEMETARTPNMDALAAESALGLTDPVMAGITPGKRAGPSGPVRLRPPQIPDQTGCHGGPWHRVEVASGRDRGEGGTSAHWTPRENVVDRRAGRIPSAESAPLCEVLDRIELEGAEVSVHSVKDHRYAAIFRGDGLSHDVSDTDSGKTGSPPLEVRPLSPGAKKMATVANEFSAKARQALAGRSTANMALLRGFLRHARCAVHHGALQAQGCRHRHVSDVSRIGPDRGHGPPGDWYDVGRRAGHHGPALGQLRLLLRPLQATDAPARTATSTPRSRLWKKWTPTSLGCGRCSRRSS